MAFSKKIFERVGRSWRDTPKFAHGICQLSYKLKTDWASVWNYHELPLVNGLWDIMIYNVHCYLTIFMIDCSLVSGCYFVDADKQDQRSDWIKPFACG